MAVPRIASSADHRHRTRYSRYTHPPITSACQPADVTSRGPREDGAASCFQRIDGVADTPAGVAVEIASTLQDHVMDDLNTTWPDVLVNGRTVVLEPRLGPDGMPRREGREVEPCPFGQLAERLT